MPTIRKSALLDLRNELIAQHQRDPSVKVDAKVIDRVVAIVGDSATVTSASIADQLKRGNLLPAEKLALARKGLSAPELEDIKAIIKDPQVSGMMDPVTANFIKALAGLEPLAAVDSVGGAARVAVATMPPSATVRAVKTMRQLVESGQLAQYYKAITGEVDDAAVKQKAMELFADLPKLNAATTADEMVATGLWTTKPRGIEEMQQSARYLPGRQVLVETTVHSNVFDDRTLLSYKEDGVKARTYRATLAGEEGDSFLVKVDGKDDPIKVPKSKIFELNQPHDYSGDRLNLLPPCDYNNPLVKAKLAEAAIKMDSLVGQLDFTKLKTEGSGGMMAVFGRGRSARQMHEVQRECVRIVHDSIDMRYTGSNDKQPGRASSGGAGRQAIKGRGVCYEQASVMLALLNPFSKMLGVDIQFISGGVYRDVHSATDNPFRGGAHGWLQLTYRPSMEHRICDRTWQQSDQAMDRAYSRYGDRYPGGFYSGVKMAAVSATDVNFSGQVSVATFDRQFGVKGEDGRERHMSNVNG